MGSARRHVCAASDGVGRLGGRSFSSTISSRPASPFLLDILYCVGAATTTLTNSLEGSIMGCVTAVPVSRYRVGRPSCRFFRARRPLRQIMAGPLVCQFPGGPVIYRAALPHSSVFWSLWAPCVLHFCGGHALLAVIELAGCLSRTNAPCTICESSPPPLTLRHCMC